jgi:hypothetical protein
MTGENSHTRGVSEAKVTKEMEEMQAIAPRN